MKWRIILIDKKELKFTLILCSLLIITLFSLNFIFQPYKSTFAKNDKADNSMNIKKDFTGDGIEDILNIYCNNNKYEAKIISNNKTYTLTPNKKLSSLGNKYSFSNINLAFCDISRDNIPEIFMCSYENNTPIFHIFSYDSEEFNDIFCSTNNTFGILDSKNNKTPKFFSLSIMNAQEKASFMLIGKNFKNISYENYDIPSLAQIQSIVTYILADYEPETSPDVFYNINSDDLAALWNLDKEHFGYSFLYGNFIDTEWNKNGEATEISWDLYFKKSSKESNKGETSLNVKLVANKIFNDYKITSISIKKN